VQILAKATIRHEVCSVFARHQVQEVVRAFNQDGLPLAILKGALFSTHYYPSMGLRTFKDIDILVSPRTRAQAAQVLCRLGYRPEQHIKGFDQEWLVAHHYHWVFLRERSLPVELHWNLTPPHSPVQFDLPGLWQRSQVVDWQGGPVCVFAPEDQLVYLAVHAAKHQFRVPLRQYVDVAMLLNAAKWDGKRVRQRAADVGAELDIATFLGIAEALGTVSLPCDLKALTVTSRRSESKYALLARYAMEWPHADCPETLVKMLAGSTPKTVLRRICRILFPGRTSPPILSSMVDVSSQTSGARVRRIHWRRLVIRLWRLPAAWASIRSAALIKREFGNRDVL